VANADNERDLLDAVKGASIAQTFRLIDKIKEVSSEDSLDAHGERWLQMRWDRDRRVLLVFAQLPEEQGARFEKIIDALAAKIPDDPMFEDGTPLGVKRADALAQLASGTQSYAASRATVVVHVDAGAFAAGRGNAEIENGPMVSAETARMVSCDGVVQAVIHDQDGTPIGAGRTTRKIPARLMRELFRRDGGCATPGCRRKKALNVHHIVHWADGGPTELDNLVLLCDVHHTIVHVGKFKICGVPPKIWIERGNLPSIRVGPPEFTEETAAMFEWEAAVVLGTLGVPDY
jgi:hypothetical protein